MTYSNRMNFFGYNLMIDADLSHVSVRYKINNMTVELLLYLCHCFNLVLAEENSANKTSFKIKQSVELFHVYFMYHKLSIFKAVFVPILTYGHESWVMTERMRSQVQASEIRALRRIEGVTLFNKVRSSEIRKSFNIEPLLLRIERSQLRWFGHVSRMPQERLPKQALHAKANGRRPVGRPRTRWTDYIEDLGWNRLGLRSSEMMEVMEDREVWRLNLELLPPQPSRKSGQ